MASSSHPLIKQFCLLSFIPFSKVGDYSTTNLLTDSLLYCFYHNQNTNLKHLEMLLFDVSFSKINYCGKLGIVKNEKLEISS